MAGTGVIASCESMLATLEAAELSLRVWVANEMPFSASARIHRNAAVRARALLAARGLAAESALSYEPIPAPVAAPVVQAVSPAMVEVGPSVMPVAEADPVTEVGLSTPTADDDLVVLEPTPRPAPPRAAAPVVANFDPEVHSDDQDGTPTGRESDFHTEIERLRAAIGDFELVETPDAARPAAAVAAPSGSAPPKEVSYVTFDEDEEPAGADPKGLSGQFVQFDDLRPSTPTPVPAARRDYAEPLVSFDDPVKPAPEVLPESTGDDVTSVRFAPTYLTGGEPRYVEFDDDQDSTEVKEVPGMVAAATVASTAPAATSAVTPAAVTPAVTPATVAVATAQAGPSSATPAARAVTPPPAAVVAEPARATIAIPAPAAVQVPGAKASAKADARGGRPPVMDETFDLMPDTGPSKPNVKLPARPEPVPEVEMSLFEDDHEDTNPNVAAPSRPVPSETPKGVEKPLSAAARVAAAAAEKAKAAKANAPAVQPKPAVAAVPAKRGGAAPQIRDGNEPRPRSAAIQLGAGGASKVLGLEEEEEPLEMGEAEDDAPSGDGFSIEVQEYETVEVEAEIEMEPVLPEPAPMRAAGPDKGQVASILQAAMQAQKRGENEEAIRLFSDVLDADPDHVVGHIGRGRLYLDLGDYVRAMSDFTVADEVAPDSPEPRIAIGDLYFARKDYRKAIDMFDEALGIAPNHAMAFCRRGISHYYRKNYNDAVDDLTRAQKLDADIPNIGTFVSMAKKKATTRKG